jgi:hypothetical protein
MDIGIQVYQDEACLIYCFQGFISILNDFLSKERMSSEERAYLSTTPAGRDCASARLAASIAVTVRVCRRNEREASNGLTLPTSKNSVQVTATVHAQEEASRSMRHSLTIFSIARVYNAGH